MDPAVTNAIAGQDPVKVAGSWQRHLPARFLATSMEGRVGYSRWGRDPGFPVLYFGRPTASVVVEAYRHLVEPVDDPTIRDHLIPRALVTAAVDVTEILDLRTARTRVEVGLSLGQMQSLTDDRDAYEACQGVAAAAHQQGFHGLIAPAATMLGDTLALFSDRLPSKEVPAVVAETLWDRLPDDPREVRPRLEVVRPSDG